MLRRLFLILSFFGTLAPGIALAQVEDAPASYALIVGTNAGGAGQAPLRFAESDAKRFSALLQTVGDTPRDNIVLALRPDRESLDAAIDRLRHRLAKHAAKGLKSQVVVYYSGHARANALVLGAEEYSLTQLRRRILDLPATLKVVILDACQSGAFSRVKGIEAAENFSVNSTRSLQAGGVVVMASSTASELSQESERLNSSIFTHHLIASLRGAGDGNDDGRVTLGEAYHYAYNATLIETSATRVGAQHVTLETRLKGKGEVILSYPRESSSSIDLPSRLTGKVLISNSKSKNVISEVIKAKGAMTIALPAGKYDVLVRRGERVSRCKVALVERQRIALQLSSCTAEVIRNEGDSKGGKKVTARPSWAVEMAFGQTQGRRDAYYDQLSMSANYGSSSSNGRLSLSLLRQIWGDRVVGVAEFSNLESRTVRNTELEVLRDEWDWTSYGVSLKARLALLTVNGSLGPIGRTTVRFFAELGGGAAVSQGTTFHREDRVRTDTDIGYLVEGGVGVSTTFDWGLGAYVRACVLRAPALRDEGVTHDVGGISTMTGLRYEWRP